MKIFPIANLFLGEQDSWHALWGKIKTTNGVLPMKIEGK